MGTRAEQISDQHGDSIVISIANYGKNIPVGFYEILDYEDYELHCDAHRLAVVSIVNQIIDTRDYYTVDVTILRHSNDYVQKNLRHSNIDRSKADDEPVQRDKANTFDREDSDMVYFIQQN